MLLAITAAGRMLMFPGQRSAAAVERQGQQNYQHSGGGSRSQPGRSGTSVCSAAAEYADHSRRQTEDQTASGRAAKSPASAAAAGSLMRGLQKIDRVEIDSPRRAAAGDSEE